MRILTHVLVVALLYPWIVGFDSVDSTAGRWSLTGAVGHGSYHQIEHDCYSVETVPVTYADSVTVDRVAPYTDAALEVRHSDLLIDYGGRIGVLAVRDNRYLFDTDRFLSFQLMDSYGPRTRVFQPVTMYYANPFFSIHGSRRSFSGHIGMGIFFGTVAGAQSTTSHLTGGGGIQFDSSFFMDLSFYESVPYASDGGPVKASIGTCIRSWNNTMLWVGGGLGAPYHDGVAFIKADAPLSERLRVALTLAGYSSSEWSLASGLCYGF